MDRDDDVERLFSWLKTPDLRYREFAGEREVADAVANWPALRRAAAESGRIDEERADTPPRVKEDQQALEHTPRPEPLEPPPSRLGAASGETPWAAPAPEPLPRRTPSAEPRLASPSRETLFGGTYRGFEQRDEDAAAPPPQGDEKTGERSLDAVFSRLSRPARRYRDERPRGPDNASLGPVFRRLR